MKKIRLLITIALVAFALFVPKAKGSEPVSTGLKLKISVNGTVLTGNLYENPSAKDFASLLPLILTLEDYAATEKIQMLPRKLSTQDAPSGADPSPGDIAYYAPWGNLAVFYKDFGYSNGLVILGKINGDMEAFSAQGPVTARFEVMNEGTTGVANHPEVKAGLQAYLDPEGNYLHVTGEFSQLTLYSLTGTVLLRTKESVTDVRHLPSGIYLAKMDGKEGQSITKKIVKK